MAKLWSEPLSTYLNPIFFLPQNQEPANPQQQDEEDTSDADSLQNSINQEEPVESAPDDLTTSTTVAPMLFQYAVSDLSIGELGVPSSQCYF